MPGTSLFALLDDIAAVLDDVALMTKVAAKKTAGVLGDDLALNAQQVSGVRAERELPVVWAVFKGSAFNKLILVPSALLVSAFIPWLITPLLMLGGMYLCFEGVEKIWHIYAHSDEVLKEKKDLHSAFRNTDVDLVAFEQDKIKGAIRTDFILSAEIIVIALGTVIDADLTVQVATVALIAIAMTIGVYGLVAFIVKLDDIGIYMRRDCTDNQQENIRQRVGAMILVCCPWLMKALSFVGTLAMFLVGGGILVHGVPILHQFAEHTIAGMSAFAVVKSGLAVLLNFIVGLFSGICALLVVRLLQSCFSKNKN